jgi:para-nitrobenzyl esterase
METVTVNAPCGPIQGREKEDVLLFCGIPYAKPPVENLRFKAPQPLAPFSEPYSALKFGPAAPQLSGGGMTDSASVRWNENCLTLNITAPIQACAKDNKTKRAVLVWIHGGAYRTGQGAIPWYNGTSFALKGNIVVVSINYRLGALGFADLTHLGEDFVTSNVNGILDQIAALKWVRDNIGAFGGDANQVTIAGESAGGFSVGTLIACQEAKGLFHRAIPQSGAAHHTLNKAAAIKVTQQFMAALGENDSIGLLAASADQILAAQATTANYFESGPGTVNSLGTAVSAFYPVHGTQLLPVDPLTAISKGVGCEVAVLTGTNADETTLWSSDNVDKNKLQAIASGFAATTALETYKKTRPEADAQALSVALTTDHMFRIPAIRMLEARLPHTENNWLYQFNWRSRAFEGKLGATHALEIPFAFDNLERAGVNLFLGPGDKPQHVADIMHEAWTKFINEGSPGWPVYELEHRSTMCFDDSSEVIDNPASLEREAWHNLR